MSALRRLPAPVLAHLLPIQLRGPSPSICIFCQHGYQSYLPRRGAGFSTSVTRRRDGASLAERTGEKATFAQEYPVITIRPTVPAPQTAVLTGSRVEEDFSLADDAQAEQDARVYSQQLRQEQKLALQSQVDDAPLHQDYVPATSWDGLELVGGEKEWDTGKKFHGFIPSHKLTTPEEITVAIYRAVVEIFAAFGASRIPRTSKFYTVGSLVNEALHVRVEVTKAGDAEGSGKIKLIYPSAANEKAVLQAGTHTSREEQETPDYTSGSLNALIKSWGRSWLHIPLHDPKIKLALVKRISRLTGAPISDHVIHNAESVAWLVTGLVKNRGSQKLYETLNADGHLAKLPNVRMLGRRETPVDKEVQVGRWKLIEAELQRRDLPVLGRG